MVFRYPNRDLYPAARRIAYPYRNPLLRRQVPVSTMNRYVARQQGMRARSGTGMAPFRARSVALQVYQARNTIARAARRFIPRQRLTRRTPMLRYMRRSMNRR